MKKIVSLMMVVMLLAVTAIPLSLFASAEAAPFNVTHFNNSEVEGACVIFTTSYSGCAWWAHVAFSPVDGEENVFEIVEIVNGLGDGGGTPLDIPEGGFVYALNSGNNWGDLTQAAIDAGNLESQWWYANYLQDEEYYTTNFQNTATQDMITAMGTWAVGDKFVFEGLNLDTLEVPTSTSDTLWYEEGYTSTATYAPAVDGDLLPSESDPTDESTPAGESDTDDKSVADVSEPLETSEIPETSENDESSSVNLVLVYVACGVAAVIAVVVVVVIVVIVIKKKK